MSTSEAATAVAQAVDDASARLVRAAALASSTSATASELAAALDEVRSGISEAVDARTLLDALDVTADLAWTDPRETLRRWLWQRQTRAGLTAQIAAALDLAESLEHVLRRRFQRRTHTVVSGETLQSIAATELGNWQRWPELADANRLDYGAPLTVGSSLVIPER